MRFKNDKDNKLYISECYYNDKGQIEGYVNPIDLFNEGLWEENLDDFRAMFHMFLQATTKPVIIIYEDDSIREET